MLAVIGQVFLHCIVSQVDTVETLLEGVLSRCCSSVAFFEPVALYQPIIAVHHNIVPKVEFSFLVQQRPFDIFLNYISPKAPVCQSLFFL